MLVEFPPQTNVSPEQESLPKISAKTFLNMYLKIDEI